MRTGFIGTTSRHETVDPEEYLNPTNTGKITQSHERVYNNYLLVGIFTILIGGTAILLLLKMSGRNEATESYYSYFKMLPGLSYGNPVCFTMKAIVL